ncbi:MAG: hypothetical protein WBC44_08020 [Planctomycetaceae bacterium]
MTPERRSRAILSSLVALGYLVLAMSITWPLATSLLDHVSLGWEGVASVPALNVWTVWWNADRAGAGLRDYWHAPIFHPTRYSFAFSEAQPTTLVVAPLASLVGPVFAYNVYLLAVLTLNGLTAFRLLRRVGLVFVPALLGGVIVETLPIVQWQLGVLQLTTLCGVLWVLDRLVALRDGQAARRTEQERTDVRPTAETSPSESPPPSLPRVRATDAVLLAVAAAACYAACNYFGLFLSVLLPLSFLPLVWGRWCSWKFWVLLVLSAAIAAGLSAPILLAQLAAKTEYKWSREEGLLYRLSAQPRDYLNPHQPPLIEGLDLKDPNRHLWTLGPGPFKVILAATGLAAGLMMRGRRRWTLFLILFGGWAFLLSLGLAWEVVDGPRIRLRATEYDPVTGWLPYRWLMAAHPGLSLARSPFRFAFFVHLAIALLAANSLDAVWVGARRLATRWRPVVARSVVAMASVFVLAVGGYAAAEIVPTKQNLFALPSLDQAWIRWLKENSDPARPILCLPFPMGENVGDYERTALFMYEQIGHRRAMVGGYSGFFPPSFLDLKSMMTHFPDEVVIDELRDREIEYVVSSDENWTMLAKRTASLRLAFRDEDAKVSVFAIQPPVDLDGRAAP